MLALGTLFHNALKEDVTAIGGMTLGSDPIAMSTSLASANTSHPVKWFTVPHTTINPGELVAVVDDVVTSGKSTIKAIEACHNHGLNIVQIIVLVDRQQSNGMKNICEMAGNIPVDAIFTKEEIKSKWMKLYPNTQ